jgi:GNAT superfamily N-acetyltransferase
MEDNSEALKADERAVPEKVDFTGLYAVRGFLPEDKNFIMSTMLKGIYYGDSWFSQIDKTLFMDNYKHIVERMLENCVVTVACLHEDANTVIGYSVLSRDFQTVVWVYVKKKWRNKGVGKQLVPVSPRYVLHLSVLGRELLSKLNGAIFNPFAPL